MQESENIVITLFLVSSLIALVLVLLVIGFVILYQQRLARQKAKVQQMEVDFQKELLREAFKSQEAERKRIAKDLHDGVGAMLSTVRLFVGKLDDSSPDAEMKSTAFEAIDETIESVRRISRDLMPPLLERYGLAHTLSNLADRISTSGKIKVECQVTDSWKRLSRGIENPLFRIAQELLNNSLKHAQASQISFSLTREKGIPIFHFMDDGFGIDPELLDDRNPKGMGLRNIESRASHIGASAEWDLNRTQGMAIRIQLPTPESLTQLPT